MNETEVQSNMQNRWRLNYQLLFQILSSSNIVYKMLNLHFQWSPIASVMWSCQQCFTIYFTHIVHPKNENSVINYSPSCRSKPVRPLFIFRSQIKIFPMKSESSLTHGECVWCCWHRPRMQMHLVYCQMNAHACVVVLSLMAADSPSREDIIE